MAKSRANAITQAILQYLSFSGVYAWRNNNAAVYDPTKKTFRTGSAKKGVGDILGVLKDGRHLEVEVKTTDRQSEAQKQHEEMVKKMGGVYILAHSVDDVVEVLE